MGDIQKEIKENIEEIQRETKKKIEEIHKQTKETIDKITNTQELQDLKIKMLGKKSELSNLLKSLGGLSKEDRPKIGNLVNEARTAIEERIHEAEESIKEKELAQKLEKEKLDITLPSTKIVRGSKHPINRVIEIPARMIKTTIITTKAIKVIPFLFLRQYRLMLIRAVRSFLSMSISPFP